MVVATASLISIGIFIAGQVIRLAESGQRNREKCRLLKECVRMISDLLTELQRRWKPDPVTGRLLQNLNDALDDGKALVQSCQERRTWSLVFRTQKKARKFDDLGERISKILEMFHVANMILIVTNRNGAPAAKACAPSSAGEVEVVARLAASVVQEAGLMRQNSEEIQQLVQFVQQVGNLMQQLQSANQWLDPKTEPLLADLKDLLHQARNILSHHKETHRSNTRIVVQAFSCAGGGSHYSQDESGQVLQVAYKIEYYVQVLPVITVPVRQIHL